MAKSRSGVGLSAKTKKAAVRRNWTSVSSGKTPMLRTPRACALVQSGPKKGKVRKGCRLTKNGAYCDELVRLPAEARGAKLKSGRRKMVKCI